VKKTGNRKQSKSCCTVQCGTAAFCVTGIGKPWRLHAVFDEILSFSAFLAVFY
jgi:hypothetical protein